MIVGLTPTLDKKSTIIGGTGYAIISNIAVEIPLNRDALQALYPDLDGDYDEFDTKFKTSYVTWAMHKSVPTRLCEVPDAAWKYWIPTGTHERSGKARSVMKKA
ncbi:hypothetical protein F5X99DRAFT_412635 [Biscogniauxia marginata]|nr:hypothetical protein F5X99DRAFT_412635 [Biscogniauxia marginata]